MPIANTDLKLRYSGGASNSNPALSIGGAKSSVDWTSNIFPAVPSAEAAAGSVKYRCVYFHNGNGTLAALVPNKVWIQTNTPSADTEIAIGIGAAAINATEDAIADENTAPAGVAFSTPGNESAGLSMGEVPAGQHRSIWIRRTITAGAAPVDGDNFTLRVKCDSAD